MSLSHQMRTIGGGLALALCLAGCSTMQKAAAGAALPLAFAGDSMLAPFQMCGNFSKYMISSGDAIGNYSEERWGYQMDVHHDNPADLFYYIPGYALAPFIPLASFDYYTMTTSCMDTLKERAPYRRSRTMYY